MDNNMNPFNGGNGNGSGNGSQGPNGSGGSEQNNPRRTSLILLAIAAIVTLISMSLFMRMINNATNQEITYGKFQELAIVRSQLRAPATFRRSPVLTSFQTARR